MDITVQQRSPGCQCHTHYGKHQQHAAGYKAVHRHVARLAWENRIDDNNSTDACELREPQLTFIPLVETVIGEI